jgi:transcriptional regulator with XRE-family HTH domain
MLRLRELRESRGIKAKDVAEMLGISYRNYQRYETGDIDKQFAKLIALADFFNVSADYLLGRTDTP